MKVLFVYSNHIGDILPAPPIGLSYVATATQAAGHDVRFVDQFLSGNNLEKLQRIIRQFLPDVIALSVRNIDNVLSQRLVRHLGELQRQIELIRAESSAIIVLGGAGISILGRRVLDHVDSDFILVGEGESTFPALLQELSNNTRSLTMPGLYTKEGPDSETAPVRCAEFGPSGMQNWIDWREYERRGATWPIQCKRGCPYKCTYCAYPGIEGRVLRSRSVEDVVEEISRLTHEVGPRCFEFVDSVFNIPEEYAAELCEGIIKAGLKVNFTTMGVNPKQLSKGLLTLMKEAGFNSLMITPESASNKVLTAMQKGFDREDVIRAAQLIRNSGIPSMWFFMLGAPGETRVTAEETITFAEQYLDFRGCLPVFTTGIRILPGTELSRQALAEGYLKPDRTLVESTFYFSPEVPEKWLLDRVDKAVAKCPAAVHAFEDPTATRIGRLVTRMMYLLGVVPPYWRFFPSFLSLSFVHRARKKK